MYNRNQIQLIGNLGQDPETGSASNGTRYARFALATTERWKDANGQLQTRTEWHAVVCWGKIAEAATWLTKGSYVTVEGHLSSREYTPEDGLKRRVWEIRASRIGFLERIEDRQDEDDSSGAPSVATTGDPVGESIPF